MNIAIASGKGGTGKTTVAVNLAAILAEQGFAPVVVDCDVEEPNAHLFLKPDIQSEQTKSLFVPKIDLEACTGPECGLCVSLCEYKAMILMVDEVMVFPELCHGCGLCDLACPEKAVAEDSRDLGQVRSGTSDAMGFFDGVLRVGEAMATPLIKAVKESAKENPLQIWDCPPGTACPVIASLDGADRVILVCEPTPFGLHDLSLAVDLVRVLDIPLAVVINRHGADEGQTRRFDEVERYLEKEDILVLARLPHSRRAATAYSKGGLVTDSSPELRQAFEALGQKVLEWAGLGGAA